MPSASRQRPARGIEQPKRTLSIRARLIILAIIAIVPIVAERIYNEHFDRAERIDAAFKQALDLARQAAAAQNDVIASTRSVLQVLAATRIDSFPLEESCDRFLKSVAAPAPWIRNLSVSNRNGILVCSSNPIAIGLDISKRPHFINTMKTGTFYVSDYLMGTRDKSPFIVAALPARGRDGSIESLVIATLDLNWLGQIASSLAARSGSVMLLIDGGGTVLAHEPNPENWIGRKLKDQPFVQDMLARPSGVVTDASLDGVHRILAFQKIPSTDAHVAIGFDESEVLHRVNQATWQAFIELGIVAMFVLLGIWFGAERLLVHPIRALIEAATRVGRGEEKRPLAGLPWAAEFVPLAAALDEMTEKLNEREQELRDSNDQLRELAQIDALTGLPNRRTFNERLAAEWKLAAKLHQPIAVLMIDVDFFKKFNDHYGHVQGDACLRKVSGVLMAATRARSDAVTPEFKGELPTSFQHIIGPVRRSDFAARYGGEEFAVLLQGADLETAMRVGERLRKGVEDLLMAHAGAPWGFISISIGVAAERPNEHGDPQSVTEAADAALYDAKRRGRNCVAKPSLLKLVQAS